jgi:hypothetical protein
MIYYTKRSILYITLITKQMYVFILSIDNKKILVELMTNLCFLYDMKLLFYKKTNSSNQYDLTL